MNVFPHEHAQCRRGLSYRIRSCNFMANRTTVLENISIIGLVLSTLELSATDHPESAFYFWNHFRLENVSAGQRLCVSSLKIPRVRVKTHTCHSPCERTEL